MLFMMLIGGAAQNIRTVAIIDFELNSAVAYLEFRVKHGVNLNN